MNDANYIDADVHHPTIYFAVLDSGDRFLAIQSLLLGNESGARRHQ